MADPLTALGQSRHSIERKDDSCDSWKFAAGILAVALLALTVVAVMARQGQLPSCTFGGQGGATVVAVASGVLTILALSLASCRKPTNGHKSPKGSGESSPTSKGKAGTGGTTDSTDTKDVGKVAAAVGTVTAASNLALAGAAGSGQRQAPPPPPNNAAGNNAAGAIAGAGNGPRPPARPPVGERQASMASNAGDEPVGPLAASAGNGPKRPAGQPPAGRQVSSASNGGAKASIGVASDTSAEAWKKAQESLGGQSNA